MLARRFVACPAFAAAFGSLMHPACAQNFSVNPVLLDTDDSEGPRVALEYELSGSLWELDMSGDGGLDPESTFAGAKLNYEGKGTIAASADRNPRNFLDLQVSFDGEYSNPALGTVIGGLVAKVEADQSFDSEQRVVGGHVTYGKENVLSDGDSIAFDVSYGAVDSVEDDARKAALGVTELDSFDRIQFEAYYSFPLPGPFTTGIQLNYRYYQEQDAPTAIEALGLDTAELATVAVFLPNDFFIAYSTGKLPFDLEDDQIFEIGFSYKLF